MNATIGRDRNGNKVVKLTFPGMRGFSIQTNGNLPKTHKEGHVYWDEVAAWVRKYGTVRQQIVYFYEG